MKIGDSILAGKSITKDGRIDTSITLSLCYEEENLFNVTIVEDNVFKEKFSFTNEFEAKKFFSMEKEKYNITDY